MSVAQLCPSPQIELGEFFGEANPKTEGSQYITPSRGAKRSRAGALVELLDGHGNSWQVVALLGLLELLDVITIYLHNT